MHRIALNFKSFHDIAVNADCMYDVSEETIKNLEYIRTLIQNVHTMACDALLLIVSQSVQEKLRIGEVILATAHLIS